MCQLGSDSAGSAVIELAVACTLHGQSVLREYTVVELIAHHLQGNRLTIGLVEGFETSFGRHSLHGAHAQQTSSE